MKRFEFDPYETLRRVRAEMAEAEKRKNGDRSPLPATSATSATRWANEGQKVAGVAEVAVAAHRSEKIIDALDHFEERAAIREYDGGLRRADAEEAAMLEAAAHYGISIEQLRRALAANKEGTQP